MTRAGFVVGLVAAALVLSGCSAATSTGEFEEFAIDDSRVSMAVEPAQEAFVEESTALQADSAGSYEPDVITTGYLSLIVDDPSASADEVSQLVLDAGGRIASRSDYSPTDYGSPSSYLELRVPYDSVETTLAAISDRGIVQESSLNSVDVSLQKVDLDARLEVLNAGITRLQALLEDAATTADVVTIESALTERQSERDSLQSQRDYLSDQTLFATISVNLYTPVDAAPRNQDGFVDGLIRGLESIVSFGAGLIVWAGILLPWLGVLALVVAAVAITRRLRGKKL
ncbi:DUF4349 domain-containing protein [Pontimonas sp.]|nr:DUF4349 domain-containing protein [Pontimonas sp.]